MTQYVINIDNLKSLTLEDICKLEQISNTRINIYERVLLMNTGITENTLETILNKSICINVLQQKEINGIILRKAQIVSFKNPQKILVIANSKIYTSRIPSQLLNDLRSMKKGIGRIIMEQQLETFKKVYKLVYIPEKFRITRFYDIMYNKQTAFKIKETFLLKNLKIID